MAVLCCQSARPDWMSRLQTGVCVPIHLYIAASLLPDCIFITGLSADQVTCSDWVCSSRAARAPTIQSLHGSARMLAAAFVGACQYSRLILL